MERVKERFYLPGYESDIEDWVRECQECQQQNPPLPHPQAPLVTIKDTYPFEKVSQDIMGPLPTTTNGKGYILVVTNIFSKWVEAFPLRSTDAETMAAVLVNEVVCRYGVPSTLYSDQGANLTKQVTIALCKSLRIKRTQPLLITLKEMVRLNTLIVPWRQCYPSWSGKKKLGLAYPKGTSCIPDITSRVHLLLPLPHYLWLFPTPTD